MSSNEKKRPSLFFVLKAIGITVYPLLLFPLLIFSTAFGLTDGELFALPRINTGLAIYTLCIAILSAYLGSLASFLGEKFLTRFGRKLPFLILHKVFYAAIFALFSLLIHWLMSPYRYSLLYLLSFVACLTTYILGAIQYGISYGNLLSYKWFVVTMTMAAVCIFFCYHLNIHFPTMIMLWSFFIQIVAYAIIMGQSNIDRMMERRNHNLSHIPKKMRNYTMVLTGILLSLTCLIFIFRNWLMLAFNWIVDLLRTLLVLLIYFISLLNSSESSVIEETPPPGQNAGGLPRPEANPFAELIDIINKILFLAVAIYLLYRFRRQILNGIRQFFSRIATWVMNLLHAVPSATHTGQDSAYYADAVTMLSYADAQEETNEGPNWRDWKRSYRHFSKLPNSEEKYRAGYKLVLSWLTLKGKPPAPGDTPLNILEQAAGLLPPDGWRPVTLSYNRIRYNPPSPPSNEELTALCAALAELPGRV